MMAESESRNENSTWQAGMSRVDITPPLGVWLMGFGARTHGAADVLDPLHATALVLTNGRERVAIVSCDLLTLDYPDVCSIRSQIAAATGIDPQHILVHATHTHSGPLVGSLRGFGPRDEAYESVLRRKIASAVIMASRRLEPVRLTYGVAPAPIGVNRRALRAGRIIIGENQTGRFDNRTAVVGIWKKDGSTEKPLGFIMWAAVHPVVLGGGNYLISRDFPGWAKDSLETAFPGSTCLYLTGPCGNINPINTGDTNRQVQARKHGTTLAGAAIMAIGASRSIASAELAAFTHTADIPLLPLPPEAEIAANAARVRAAILAGTGDTEKQLAIDYRLRWAEAALASLRHEPGALPQTSCVTAELQLLVIGDLAITTLPFEAFVEYQEIAAATAPCKDTLLAAYSNGNYGYMFTEAAFAEGGYEVDSAFQVYALQQFAPQAPAAVITAIRQLHSLYQAV